MERARSWAKSTWARLAIVTIAVSLALFVVLWGCTVLPSAWAAKPEPAPQATPDSAQRTVAILYGSTAVTREQFGDYLIQRLGADRLELFVNKLIIEHECKERNIIVTDTEIDAALNESLHELGVDLKTFVNKLLKQYNKSLYEWREDVIRPRLAMTKLCRDRIKVTAEDMQHAFEAEYGEKVECRVIIFPPGHEKLAMQSYDEIRSSDEGFDSWARKQASPTLAMSGGKLSRPISRFSTGNEALEKEAMSLKEGEVSKVVATPQGQAVLKCDKRIPARTDVKLDQVRDKIEKEVLDKKVQAEMAGLFKELRDKADPKLFLKKSGSLEDLKRDVEKEISLTPGKAQQPMGN